MVSLVSKSLRPRVWVVSAFGLCLAGILFIPACGPITEAPSSNDNSSGNSNSNVNDNVSGSASTRVINLQTNFSLSSRSQPISIIYSVQGEPEVVSGVYVPMDAGGGEGDPVVITGAENLPVGTTEQFLFDPRQIPVGSYRVGILVQAGGEETVYLGNAVIQIQGQPQPMFILPAEAVTEVHSGTSVPISFTAGDPENEVQWRLFFLSSRNPRNATPDVLGTQITTGAGNVGLSSISTSNLPAGDYELGIAATDSGFSVVETVRRGDLDKIITIPNSSDPTAPVSGPIVRVLASRQPLPPTVIFSAPGISDVSLFLNQQFSIEYSVTIREPDAVGTVDVIYDNDNLFANGYTGIARGLPVTRRSYPFPTDLPAGTYYVGVVADDGVNPRIAQYAAGSITVVRNATLTVIAPNTDQPVEPSTSVEVEWETNVPASTGRTVDVFARALDAQNVKFGPELLVRPAGPLTTSTADFNSVVSGRFAISVRITFANNEAPPLIVDAPKPVRVSSLPRILWLGALANEEPEFEGAIFEGHNTEDNAGTAFTAVGDLDGDTFSEFVINARYGKPFFDNPADGIGHGEAYIIYGGSGDRKLQGEYSLNSVGTAFLRGVVFAGIRTPEGNSETDGLSSVIAIPDVDGDRKDELVFGFPNTQSRGHNVDSRQNGVVDPRSLSTLEREDQFLNGGIVMVSSQNSILKTPTRGVPLILLDLVGQDFDSTCVSPEPAGLEDGISEEFGANNFSRDILNPLSTPTPCAGTCEMGQGGGRADANNTIDFGFARTLARDYFFTYVFSAPLFDGVVSSCEGVDAFVPLDPCFEFQYCLPFPSGCEPFSPGLHSAVPRSVTEPFEDDFFGIGTVEVWNRRSGYYSAFVNVGSEGNPVVMRNDPREPFGARIIGVGLGDEFGTSVTVTRATGGTSPSLIVSAPKRTARGILLGPTPAGCVDPPTCGGEINGLVSSPGTAKINADSGVAYLFDLRSLWTDDDFGRVPPRPHQYIVGEASHCGGPLPLIPNLESLRIAGFGGDQITNIIGINDFNADRRDDFAIGAPEADGGKGRLYIGFRRDPAVEGDYVLEKLALAPNNADRLTGVLITTATGDALGASLATGMDFNGDGLSDLVVGSPNAASGRGEIIIVFGDRNLVTPENGTTVLGLLADQNAAGGPRAVRIRGSVRDPGGHFGFNVANAGDVDGDGANDLLIAAPDATPRFDPNPNDAIDELTMTGVDQNFDGRRDDVSGPNRVPDGNVTAADELAAAGLVYILSSRNRLDQLTSADRTLSIDVLGGYQLRGYMIAGRRAGDRIGGGDAGMDNEAKENRGRSLGLASAGDVDGDRRADILIGSILADPRIDPNTGEGIMNGGEAYLIYGSAAP